MADDDLYLLLRDLSTPAAAMEGRLQVRAEEPIYRVHAQDDGIYKQLVIYIPPTPKIRIFE